MAAKTAAKTMTIRVKLDGKNDLRFTAKETRANLAKLVEMFGEAHVIVPRNPWGRKGAPKPAPVKRTRKSAKVTATA